MANGTRLKQLDSDAKGLQDQLGEEKMIFQESMHCLVAMVHCLVINLDQILAAQNSVYCGYFIFYFLFF